MVKIYAIEIIFKFYENHFYLKTGVKSLSKNFVYCLASGTHSVVLSTTLNKGKGHWVEVAAELGLAKQGRKGRFFVRLLLFKAKYKGQCIGSREATALFFLFF